MAVAGVMPALTCLRVVDQGVRVLDFQSQPWRPCYTWMLGATWILPTPENQVL
jgi:hypothetical protein